MDILRISKTWGHTCPHANMDERSTEHHGSVEL